MPGEFTYHRKGKGLVVGFTVVMAAEALITHGVLLAIFGGVWWTWMVLGFGLYSAAWILARYYVSYAVRPHVVTDDTVVLRCGTTGELVVPRHSVVGARPAPSGQLNRRGHLVVHEPDATGRRRAWFSNGGGCNVTIDLAPTATLTFNGKPVPSAIDILHVNADDPDGLARELART